MITRTRNLFTFFALFTAVCPLEVISGDYNGPSSGQADVIISQLSQTHATLSGFKVANEVQLNALKDKLDTIDHTLVTQLTPDRITAFDDVRNLSQKDILLLEAAYSFAKQNEAQAGLSENSLKTLAFEKCINDGDCTFEKLNSMIDEEALKLAVEVKKQSVSTQKDLLEKINTLNDFISDSQNSETLSYSIKILSKINIYQGQMLTRLSEQIAILSNLEAHKMQLEHQSSVNQEKASEQFFNAKDTIHSKHLNISLQG